VTVGDKCAREGCNRGTRKGGDEFCSRLCAQKHYGVAETMQEVRERIRGDEERVERASADAMRKRVPGSYGTGKRR